MSIPPKGTNQLRKGRISTAGTVYFITKVASERVAKGQSASEGILLKEGIPQIIVDSLDWLESKSYIELLAYVIMPDHVHLVFKLHEERTLSEVIRSFAGFTGKEIGKHLGRPGSIWQVSYQDHGVRNDTELTQIYQYILDNPVKAGYIEDGKKWPWMYISGLVKEYRGLKTSPTQVDLT